MMRNQKLNKSIKNKQKQYNSKGEKHNKPQILNWYDSVEIMDIKTNNIIANLKAGDLFIEI